MHLLPANKWVKCQNMVKWIAYWALFYFQTQLCRGGDKHLLWHHRRKLRWEDIYGGAGGGFCKTEVSPPYDVESCICSYLSSVILPSRDQCDNVLHFFQAIDSHSLHCKDKEGAIELGYLKACIKKAGGMIIAYRCPKDRVQDGPL